MFISNLEKKFEEGTGKELEKKPIGIFDSGVGGLTVFREIRRSFPQEDIVYFGDTARVPYGPKSHGTVIEYSIQNARFLMQCGAKIIVVACNTSSAVALSELSKNLPIPVLGVIQPGAVAALQATQTKRIGVIGTEGTVRSNAYADAIAALDPEARVFSQACPLFVSLAEEGWEDHPVTKMVIAEYLAPLMQKNIDTLVLGCTHYPIMKKAIGQFLGEKVTLVDSAEAVTAQLQNLLTSSSIGQP
ncbi:MAG TPA: glutamate racemase, partial [Candidatus Cloacimonadota bacterium]|nr:glutamate racemase [Candidatus Cloacimonadota bacterium]